MTARVVISAVLLGVAALLFSYNPTQNGQELATTIIGVILGYWFNHAERQVTGNGSKPAAPPPVGSGGGGAEGV